MEVTSFGLGVVAEVRNVAQSIIRRIENYRQGRKTFRSLIENLSYLTENIEDVDNHLQKFPNVLPVDIQNLFNRTFAKVRNSLLHSEATVEKDFAETFAGSSSGFFGNFKTKAYRAIRANALKNKMNAVETQIKEASGELLQLLNFLAPKIDNLRVNESSKGEYRPATSAPAVSHIVSLDFDAKDADGKFATPEGVLKDGLLARISPETVAAAAGKLNPAYGVVGMAGAGKTIALHGLAGDKDIRERFPDGIQYMSLGHEASDESVIQEIAGAMTRTGAMSSVRKVENSTSLREAVDNAVLWFQGKRFLLLIDDMWPTDGCPTGYLAELRQLLRESPSSRMVITTRNVEIALEAGYYVEFGARDPLGAVSVVIFMKYATFSMTSGPSLDAGDALSSTLTKILTWCGGLPIALSVTGSAVALLARNFGSLERALEKYVTNFEERKTNVGEEEDRQGMRLSDGIRLSLNYLDVEFSKWKKRQALDNEHTISDLYTSLCVFSNQVWIPVLVLSRMWQLSEKSASDVVGLFCRQSLAALSYRRIGDGTVEAGITLHDLHLEFCKRQAGSKNLESMWHSTLLNRCLGAPTDSVFFDPCTRSAQQLVDVTPRSWWSIPDDGYTHAHLARHLLFSDRAEELAALLLDARWVTVRGALGGILGLKADFVILDKLLQAGDSGIRKSFQLVLEAMQLSWGSFSDGRRAFQFQMCGRLLSLRKDDVIIDAALKSYESHTPTPYLMPVSRFFPHENIAQICEIPVGHQCRSVTCSPCGHYIAAGAGHGIVIADAFTGDEVKRLEGHRDVVQCIKFGAASKEIVSASRDMTVAVWAWETSDAPIMVLEGHSGWVTGIDVSRDGKYIVSVSHDCTLRFWNGTTGFQFDGFAQSSRVLCVALCSDDRKVAIGLENGTVKVLDRCTREILFEDTEAHAKDGSSVAFSPDGGCMATCSWDETIRLWDAETWAAIALPIEGHTEKVRSVAFSPDGLQLVSGSYDNTVRLWDVAQAKSVGVSSDRLAEFSADLVSSVSFSCNGERIVTGSFGGIVRIWNVAFVSEEKQQRYGHTKKVYGVSISPDGLRVASGALDNTLLLWDTQTGAQIRKSPEGHTRSVTTVSFSPDGRHLVFGSTDKTLRMWDTEACTQIGNPFEGHSDKVRCVAFSSHGERIVSGGGDKTVRLWNVESREQIGDPLTGHKNWVRNISETSDGRYIVSRDWTDNEDERETIIWNRDSRAIVWRSKETGGAAKNRFTNIRAESITRSCGQVTPYLWPSSFPAYAAELFCEVCTVYSDVNGDKIVLGNLPSYFREWKYDSASKVFAAALSSGGVAICRFVQ